MKSSAQTRIKFFYYKGSGVEIFQNTSILSSCMSPHITKETLYLNGTSNRRDYTIIKTEGIDCKLLLRLGLLDILKINRKGL